MTAPAPNSTSNFDAPRKFAATAEAPSAAIGRWPEQIYNVRSRIQFPRMREIFFATSGFDLHGEGNFDGTFRLFKGGRELTGNFHSREAGLNAYRFPDLEGSLIWVPEKFEVTRASSGFYGGRTAFSSLMAPLNVRGQGSRAPFLVDYTEVDLLALTNLLETRGLRASGRATGHNRLEWPMGRFAERDGDGHVVVTPPPGVMASTRQVIG